MSPFCVWEYYLICIYIMQFPLWNIHVLSTVHIFCNSHNFRRINMFTSYSYQDFVFVCLMNLNIFILESIFFTWYNYEKKTNCMVYFWLILCFLLCWIQTCHPCFSFIDCNAVKQAVSTLKKLNKWFVSGKW